MASKSTREFPDIHWGRSVYDVVIVGAGVQGSATAYECVKQGLKTLLLEQFSLPHSRGSSHGQSRIIRYSYEQTHYSQMMNEAYPMWTDLEKETGTKLNVKTGLLTMSVHKDGPLYHNSLHQMKLFNRKHKIVDYATLKRDYPELEFSENALVFMDYDGGTLRADKALQAYQGEFLKRGGELQEEEEVSEILPGTLVTVRTPKGEYRARQLILTPGAWAPKILRPLGLDPPLKVIRINVPYWKEKEPDSMKNLPNCIFELEDNTHIYSLQCLEYPGLTKLVLHDGEDKVDPDYRDSVHDSPIMEKEELRILTAFVLKHFPLLESTPSVIETCMYTNTPDSELIIDRHPLYPNILVCCGCSGHGFKLSPSIGKIMCRLAMGKQSHIDISGLSFKRFKNSCLTTNKPKL